MTTALTHESWASRAHFLADLVAADALVVTIGSQGAGHSVYASHNLGGAVMEWDRGTIARAMQERSITVARVTAPLADRRIGSELCVAPIVWKGNVIGSLTAVRVERAWGDEARAALARSADLVALELAETHARQWWQRSAETWQRRVRLLEQVRAELGSDPDPAGAIETAAARVASLAGATGASVMLIDDDGDLVVRSAYGPHEDRARSARRQIGEGISGWVAAHGEPLLLRGRVEDQRFSGVDPTIEESLVVPVRFEGRILGVVATRTNRSGDAYANERLKDLDVVAGELAGLIMRAKAAATRIDLTTRLENDRREAIAMYDLARLAGIGADPEGDLGSAAQLIADAFGHDSVAIWTIDPDTGQFTLRTALGYGEVLPGDPSTAPDEVIRSALASQQSRLVVGPARAGWGCTSATTSIVAPITLNRDCAGLMVLGRRNGPYTHFDFTLATTMTDVLSSLVRREIAARRAELAEVERRELVARMEEEFAQEMGRVVYVLDACQRLLAQDRTLPTDLARAARDARSALKRLGIPLAQVEPTSTALPDGGAQLAALAPHNSVT